jgi:ppGpp synthetase/RelA/SpoT-type nucleotidyltranferase
MKNEIMITKGKINRVGKYLIGKNSAISKTEANDVLKNFRLIHQHPMILFRNTIDRKLKKHSITALVSQRLKRIPSIIKKLEIQENMNLSRMQDIGGLRIVVKTIKEVNLIREELKKTEKHNNFKFTFAKEEDYIKNPPESGYRSIHMIYKYDKDIDLNKQCILEVQIRTQLQHSWATAVEVTGTYLNQSLKQGLGEEKYLNIFKKISKLFISLETKKINYEFIKEVKQDIEKVELLQKLKSFNIVSKHLESNAKGEYVLLKMNFKKEQIGITQYSSDKFEQANKDYLKM